jgi:hypothetical protein
MGDVPRIVSPSIDLTVEGEVRREHVGRRIIQTRAIEVELVGHEVEPFDEVDVDVSDDV